MFEAAFGRLRWSLVISLLLAVSTAVAQGQDSTQTTTLQQRSQRSELRRIAGVLFRGDTAIPQPGLQFVKVADGSVAVRRFGAATDFTNVTCVGKQGSGSCQTVVQLRRDEEGETIAGFHCEPRGCQRCEFEKKPVTQMGP